MVKLSPNLQHLTDELPANRRAEVEEAIVSSPYVRQIMTEAVNAGTLEHIRMGVPGANEGGHYDDQKRAIYLSPDTFAQFEKKGKLLDAITSTLGHETGHALNAEKTREALYFVTGSITDQIRAAEGGKVDMTPLMGMYLHNMRSDEASAEIHGWNALASRIEYTTGKSPDRDDMLRRADASTDCVEQLKKGAGYRLAPGIILDTDMQMSETRLQKVGPINLEPVAQCHFDNPRASLGAGGAADYPNYYAAYMIQQIANDTNGQTYPARVEIDMAKLGLDKAQLESTGLRLGGGGFFFTDISNTGHKPVVLHSSGRGIQGIPDAQEPALAGPSPSTPSAPLMTAPAHTAHVMYLRAQGALGQVEAAPGMGGLTQHERQTLGASVVAETLSAEGWNFTRIDHAVPGKIDPQTGRPEALFLVQGALDDPAHRRIGVNMEQALSQSIEQSSTVSQAMLQTRDQAMALEQQRAEQKEQDGPQGPTMRIGPRTPSPSQGPQGDGGGGD